MCLNIFRYRLVTNSSHKHLLRLTRLQSSVADCSRSQNQAREQIAKKKRSTALCSERLCSAEGPVALSNLSSNGYASRCWVLMFPDALIFPIALLILPKEKSCHCLKGWQCCS
jgi:hypothetical protein